MPKNIEDIIVPSERRRSIRDIPIPENRRKNGRHNAAFAARENRSAEISTGEPGFLREERNPSKISRKGVWTAAGAALLVLIFAILSAFNGATLAYVPKSTTLSFGNEIFKARKVTGNGDLLYSIVKLSKDKGLEISALGEEEEVRRKSKGTIVVYNNASTEAQRLIENTRFETPDGLVYRIQDAIVIPGKRTVAGISQPGSIEVVVYADEAGEKYNIGLSDFTVPGLAGTSRSTTIYARSKTPMSGGFVGRQAVVSDQEKARAEMELESSLKSELISEAKAQVPEGFILLPSLSSVTFEDLPQTNSRAKGRTTINMRANLLGVMFKKSDLSTHLALNKVALEEGELIDIVELDSLTFSFADASSADLSLLNEISFSVAGEVMALWRTDEVALKADLVGRRKKDIPSILNNYPTVASATATLRPFWKKTFPADSTKISIKKLPAK